MKELKVTVRNELYKKLQDIVNEVRETLEINSASDLAEHILEIGVGEYECDRRFLGLEHE